MGVRAGVIRRIVHARRPGFRGGPPLSDIARPHHGSRCVTPAQRSAGTPGKPDDVAALLADFAPEVAALARRLRARLLEHVPDLEERVYRGWRGLGYHARGAGYLCALFPLDGYVDVAFEHGADLEDPAGLFYRGGTQVRFARFDPDGLDEPRRIEELLALLDAAIALRSM